MVTPWEKLNMTQPLNPLNYSINLKVKSLHSYIVWSELYLEVNIPPQLEKSFRFTVFRLLKNVFANPPPLDMIWSLVYSCRTTPTNLTKKVCRPLKNLFLQKNPSILLMTPYFPKAENYVVCAEFAMGSKFHFSQWKIFSPIHW